MSGLPLRLTFRKYNLLDNTTQFVSSRGYPSQTITQHILDLQSIILCSMGLVGEMIMKAVTLSTLIDLKIVFLESAPACNNKYPEGSCLN